MHPVIAEDRKDRQRPVRVAILDTGVDARHPDLLEALRLKKIEGYRSFPSTLDPLLDRHGHGTHAASVVLKIAPHVVLYIARIADDDGRVTSENGYAAVAEVDTYTPFLSHR